MRTLALAFALGCAAFAGCGGEQVNQVVPGPAIANLNLTGFWYCTEFGDMRLTQEGKQVSGTWEDRRGKDHNGTVRGTIQGDIIWVNWLKPGNPLAAIQPIQGKGYLRITNGGRELHGMWGFDDSQDDGGPWNAEKSQF